MKLFHCADIQLRPLTRHDEFKSVFEKFYTSLLKNNADKNSIIVICGDIVQEKDKLKPETIMVLREFFKKLVDISKCVVVICGNHDTIEYNKERLDNLTPILDNIDGIHYLKYSGEYVINKVKFVVNSIVDNKFIYDVKKSRYPIVGLYHGMINNCKLDNGIVVKNKVGIKDFINYDFVLLGDIHKHQYMTPNIAYSGSLVQQNFGEPYRGHGYIIWDLQKNKSKFVEIKSDYGFFNIYSSKDVNDICCPYAYIRYHVDNESKVEKLKKKVEDKCQVLREEVRIVNNNLVKNIDLDVIEQCQFDDTTILKNYTEDKNIIRYHKKLKLQLEEESEFGSFGYWTIDYLEFKNMLIYGGSVVNKVKFNNGVISICGDNAIGKSCILKLIVFALFDKTCSNDKNSIIHKGEKSCYIRVDFSFTGNKGKKYSILRKGAIR
ncbi:MAG: AAA family ATPase, partial [Romboutsia sp.]|nr:AAA family ATPase [Romboutsia sp.]